MLRYLQTSNATLECQGHELIHERWIWVKGLLLCFFLFTSPLSVLLHSSFSSCFPLLFLFSFLIFFIFCIPLLFLFSSSSYPLPSSSSPDCHLLFWFSSSSFLLLFFCVQAVVVMMLVMVKMIF